MGVVRYRPEDKNRWDNLVQTARNGLFIFERAYMDYHSDRFDDCSALILDGSEVVAGLPATIDGNGEISSHAGLTFGGLIVSSKVRGDAVVEVIERLLESLTSWGGSSLEVRIVPPWLCSYPSQEFEYALWLRGFHLCRRDLSSLLPLGGSIPIKQPRQQGIAKAKAAGITAASADLAGFHTLLEQVLRERHGVAPVHTLAELHLLQSRFPDRLLLRTAHMGSQIVAGTIVYRYPTAWHTQYLAVSDAGRALGALDFLLGSVIDEARSAGARYLSFGTSTTNAGRDLNSGLLFQKEGFGARSIVHDFWRGPLA
jgi:hypothetical protein